MAKINIPISPYKGVDNYIFVSYSHRNTDAVWSTIEHLQNDGYRVWYDEGIDPGTEWDENIAYHVENCFCFVAFLSKEYLDSSNCKDELNFARELDKPRLLVYLEDITLPSGLRMRLSRLQAIHMYKYDDIHIFYEKLYDFPAIQSCKALAYNHHVLHEDRKEAMLHVGGKCYSGVLIGQGYVGRVYKAYDEIRKVDFVFKKYDVASSLHIPFFTRNDLGNDLQTLDHKNLCRVQNIIRGNEPTVIMDYIAGETLENYLQNNTVTICDGLKIVLQILNALSALHNKGIYYGDVTPYNIMISNHCVYLCDYSASNYNGSKYDAITTILHKYSSPDREPGQIMDFKSDIYEVGMVLDSLTLNLISAKMAHDIYINRSELQLEKSATFSPLEHQVQIIIERATKRDAKKRYSSANAMIKDIEKALALV